MLEASDLGNEDAGMPKEQSPGKPTTRRYSPEEKAAAGADGAGVARRTGYRAGDRATGSPPARLRRRVGTDVGAPGRYRRRISSRGIDRRIGAGQGTRAREPRTQARQRDS